MLFWFGRDVVVIGGEILSWGDGLRYSTVQSLGVYLTPPHGKLLLDYWPRKWASHGWGSMKGNLFSCNGNLDGFPVA